MCARAPWRPLSTHPDFALFGALVSRSKTRNYLEKAEKFGLIVDIMVPDDVTDVTKYREEMYAFVINRRLQSSVADILLAR